MELGFVFSATYLDQKAPEATDMPVESRQGWRLVAHPKWNTSPAWAFGIESEQPMAV